MGITTCTIFTCFEHPYFHAFSDKKTTKRKEKKKKTPKPKNTHKRIKIPCSLASEKSYFKNSCWQDINKQTDENIGEPNYIHQL